VEVLGEPLDEANVTSRGYSQSNDDAVPLGPTGPVGVGIAIARDPLPRSGQALLTHPAPALGDNAQAL
jgi:hypothetical protein